METITKNIEQLEAARELCSCGLLRNNRKLSPRITERKDVHQPSVSNGLLQRESTKDSDGFSSMTLKPRVMFGDTSNIPRQASAKNSDVNKISGPASKYVPSSPVSSVKTDTVPEVEIDRLSQVQKSAQRKFDKETI